MSLELEILEKKVVINKNSDLKKESIKALSLEKKNRVLELGHGCFEHLDGLMAEADDLKYFGLDISDKIIKATNEKFEHYLKEAKALFQVYDGEKVPYVQNMFDRILSVNNFFFYQEPLEYINELYRSLKDGGTCIVSFYNAMDEFSEYNNPQNFENYSVEKLNILLEKSDFTIYDVLQNSEKGMDYFIVSMSKPKKIRFYR